MAGGVRQVADGGSQQRKPDSKRAVEDVKALVTVLVMKLESVLGRRLKLRSPAVLAAIGVVATLVLALAVVMVLLQTGDANAVSDNAAVIGALVALGGVFTAQMVSIALDDRRTQESRELEYHRASEAALRKYLEDVGSLLIEQPLHRASRGDRLSILVRAQTLAVLAGLDADRKRILLEFLREARLIQGGGKSVVSLESADLSEADLSNTAFSGVDFSFTNLNKADLSGADLRGAGLSASLKYAKLSNADLSGATLLQATLTGADLSGASLRGAFLGYANLSGATLTGADLSGALGIPDHKLEQQPSSLEGAIMPNGQKYEVWLKNRVGG